MTWAGAPLRLNHRRLVSSLARLLSSLARLPLRFRLNLHHTTFSNVFLRLFPAKAYLFYVSSRLLTSCDVILHPNSLRPFLRLMSFSIPTPSLRPVFVACHVHHIFIPSNHKTLLCQMLNARSLKRPMLHTVSASRRM